MKSKLLIMSILFAVVLLFVGCGAGEETPDPEASGEVATNGLADEAVSEGDVSLKSVVFTETGEVLYLGDERASFDRVLGEGVESGNTVSYLGGTFTVRFEDGVAITFVRMWEFERIVFPAFDANRSISSIMRDLMFDPFFEHPNAEHVYVAVLEVGEGVYVLQVTMGLTNGELSHVESITLHVFDN